MSAPMTARARARAELTAEIKAAARRQVADVGAAALSLRAVARELGMVSSAVYRYFPSRDELLTALIVDAYDAVGAAAEASEQASSGAFVDRWVTLAAAIRRWALGAPHEYALVYGSPVPGYRAPTDTVAPAVRVSAAALRIVSDGFAAGEIDPTPRSPIPRSVKRDLAALRELVPGVPDEVLDRTLGAWAGLFGTLSFELFGHLEGVVSDFDVYFAQQARRAARLVASG